MKLGVVYEIGQPVHRIGATIGFFINKGSFQLCSSHAVVYCFRNYGPELSRWELQSDLMLGLGFGQRFTTQENVALLSSVSNYSNRQNLFSYGLKYYYDKIETKQLTGAVNLRIHDYFIATENDGFVFLPFDKYRTGAISIGKYFFSSSNDKLFKQNRISVDFLLFTGQTQGPPTEKIIDAKYPSRFGYKKLNDSKYSKSSHGILRLNWTTSLVQNQNTFIEIGLDNEHIRNVVQNQFIHDLPFIPKKLIKIKNPHVPMRNAEGRDYLYRENEKIRKGKFVWGAGLNRPYFY